MQIPLEARKYRYVFCILWPAVFRLPRYESASTRLLYIMVQQDTYRGTHTTLFAVLTPLMFGDCARATFAGHSVASTTSVVVVNIKFSIGQRAWVRERRVGGNQASQRHVPPPPTQPRRRRLVLFGVQFRHLTILRRQYAHKIVENKRCHSSFVHTLRIQVSPYMNPEHNTAPVDVR